MVGVYVINDNATLKQKEQFLNTLNDVLDNAKKYMIFY